VPPPDLHHLEKMTQLTLNQSLVLISSAGAAWMMVRAGTALRALTIRDRPRCASCGRKLTGKTCSCST
jgi:hypothetical protein